MFYSVPFLLRKARPLTPMFSDLGTVTILFYCSDRKWSADCGLGLGVPNRCVLVQPIGLPTFANILQSWSNPPGLFVARTISLGVNSDPVIKLQSICLESPICLWKCKYTIKL